MSIFEHLNYKSIHTLQDTKLIPFFFFRFNLMSSKLFYNEAQFKINLQSLKIYYNFTRNEKKHLSLVLNITCMTRKITIIDCTFWFLQSLTFPYVVHIYKACASITLCVVDYVTLYQGRSCQNQVQRKVKRNDLESTVSVAIDSHKVHSLVKITVSLLWPDKSWLCDYSIWKFHSGVFLSVEDIPKWYYLCMDRVLVN